MQRICAKIIVSAILIIVAPSLVFAQGYPYEWLSLGMSEDPATIQRVRWRTDLQWPDAVAQITPAVPTPDLTESAWQGNVVSEMKDDYGLRKYYHHATFSGLEPGTRYLYRVGDGDRKWSEWYEFKTAECTTAPFSFIYMADVQKGIYEHYPRVIRNAYGKAPDASFIMFTGDMTGRATEAEWNDFFYANGWIFGMKPVVAIPDNHEYDRNRETRESSFTTYWDHLFSYPENTPEKFLSIGTYYYDYQGCRFIMMNSKEIADNGQQYVDEVKAWAEDLMRTNPYKWCIVGHHRPVYSMATGRNDTVMRENFQALYDKYDVDMVLTGHDHIYSRMRAVGRQGGNGKLTGPVYVVSVAGSQVYLPQYNTYSERMGSNLQLFQHITVDGNVMTYNAYDALGDLYDSFTITKKRKTKKFRDLSGGIPERTEIPAETEKYSPQQLEQAIKGRTEYENSKKQKPKPE